MIYASWLKQISLGYFLLFVLCNTMIVTGCTESVHKVSPVRNSVSSLNGISSDRSTSQLANKTPQELISAGREYMASGNQTLARMHFVTALNNNPGMAEAYIALGELDLQNKNYSAALENFESASQDEESPVSALLGQAQAYRHMGEMNQSIEKINKAMLKNGDDVRVIMELATIYDTMGKENLAAPLYQEIIDRAPDSATGYNNLGLNQLVKEEYSNAVLSFTQAMNLTPDNNQIKNNLGTAYALSGDESKAIHIFKSTVGEAGAYNNVGYLYMTQGEFDKAERALRKAMSLNPRYYVRAQENLDRLQQMRRDNRN